MAAPLDGIRVLEVANGLAAPAATALMADLGVDGGELGQLAGNGVPG